MTALLLLPLLLPPLVAAACLPRRHAGWVRYAEIGVSAVVLLAGLGLVLEVRADGPVTAAGDLLRVDALSAYLLAVVGAVALTSTWGGLPPRGSREPDGRYAALVSLFLGAMSLALLADDLGVLWVAIEATTITTAFLVGHHGGRQALEAAWKYVVLGSVGVAIALLGVVLLYAAASAAGEPTLSWVRLSEDPPPMDHALVRLAVALAALGFATKAGLAPMHSWLPDAHSQAPAPVSGLMSGVLLAVAFYAILRVQAVSDATLGPGLMRSLLLAAGLLSLAVAAALLLRQCDYKRMLAYSSVEHMGLLALGAAAGGTLALAAVLLHVLGHGLTKSSLFVVAGRVLTAEGSSRTGDVQSLLARRPALGIPLLVGMAALLGFPPFGLFFTEVAILLAGFRQGLGWAMGLALALLLVIFAGLARATLHMTLGPADGPRAGEGASPAAPTTSPAAATAASLGPVAPLALALGLSAALGAAAWPLSGVLRDAAAVLVGAS